MYSILPLESLHNELKSALAPGSSIKTTPGTILIATTLIDSVSKDATEVLNQQSEHPALHAQMKGLVSRCIKQNERMAVLVKKGIPEDIEHFLIRISIWGATMIHILRTDEPSEIEQREVLLKNKIKLTNAIGTCSKTLSIISLGRLGSKRTELEEMTYDILCSIRSHYDVHRKFDEDRDHSRYLIELLKEANGSTFYQLMTSTLGVIDNMLEKLPKRS